MRTDREVNEFGFRTWYQIQWEPLGRLYEEITGRPVDVECLDIVLDAVYPLLIMRFSWSISAVRRMSPGAMEYHLKLLLRDRECAASQPEGWPPDQGWHFRSRQFAFDYEVHSLRPRLNALLEVLVSSKYPKTLPDLRSEVWDDDYLVEDKTIRSSISELRKVLRKLGPNPQDDPIPHGKSGWRLDRELIEKRCEARSGNRALIKALSS